MYKYALEKDISSLYFRCCFVCLGCTSLPSWHSCL